jgi:hypothetical protein
MIRKIIEVFDVAKDELPEPHRTVIGFNVKWNS